ncbi:MAG: hypothetical protein ACPIOQ_83960, partial [Promethearchaeia archaeon]
EQDVAAGVFMWTRKGPNGKTPVTFQESRKKSEPGPGSESQKSLSMNFGGSTVARTKPSFCTGY